MFVKFETDPDFKENAKSKLKNAVEWLDNHKWFISTVVSITSTVLYFSAKKHGKATVKLSNDYKDRHIYDPSLGHYWELNRKLNNREWQEIERRLANGEKYGQILSSMGVLK